jgi:hypothetical protein
MSSTEVPAVQMPKPPAASASWWDISAFVRRFLCTLIVDIAVEFYARTKSDPEFQKRLGTAFGKLDASTSQTENDAAILELQDLISN